MSDATSPNLDYAASLARAAGGALLFAFPLLMTMEMWQLGHSMDRGRLLVFIVSSLPMLLGLSYLAGFEATFRLLDELFDALAAFAVGVLVSAAALILLGQVGHGMSWDELTGKVLICTVPASIGALLASKQFNETDRAQERRKARIGYGWQLFTMSVGAIFLAFNVAPTEEMQLIAFQMTPWHALATVAVTILLLHVIVYRLGFKGQEGRQGDQGFVRAALAYTAPGYGIALLLSLYCLWIFGRTDGTSLHETAMMVSVLAFPAGLGAATARLVV